MGAKGSKTHTNGSIHRPMKSENELNKDLAKQRIQKLLKNKYQRKRLVEDFVMHTGLKKIQNILKKTVGNQFSLDDENKKLIITGIPEFEYKKKKAFKFLFRKRKQNNNEALKLKKLLNDLSKEKYLCENDILLISCYFYHLIFLNIMKKNCSLKRVNKVLVFKVCIYLSQKYHLDVHYDSKSMSNILNVNKNKLLALETFLLIDVLEFRFKMLTTQKFRDIFYWFSNVNDILKKNQNLITYRKTSPF